VADWSALTHLFAFLLDRLGVKRSLVRIQSARLEKHVVSASLRDRNRVHVTCFVTFRFDRRVEHIGQGTSQQPDQNCSSQEMLEELVNHCKLLGDILRPIYEEAGLELKRGEKRVLGRLIGEMTGLIVQLKKTWSVARKN
jgi:hypothetical protein